MIQVLLWDIDGTLLDFTVAESYALKRCFRLFGLGECTDEMVARYSVINRKYWKMLERGEITKPEVLHRRYAEFFTQEGIPLPDIDALNREYQVLLGDKIVFHDDGLQIVRQLRPLVRQYAVTNGTVRAQRKKLRLSGLEDVFDGVFISDEIGYEKPTTDFFDVVFRAIGPVPKDQVMIIGDSLTSDMQGGNNAGIRCCWYHPRQDHRDTGSLRLDYEIADLHEIPALLAREQAL